MWLSQVYCFRRLDLTICCHRVEDLDAETKDWTFKLTKSNMQGL